jgi:hypothetical protein
MKNIEIIEIQNLEGQIIHHVIIDRGNGEFTSMPKDVYDAMQAEQSTPNLAD